MSSVDWCIIVVYLLGMIGLSVYMGRGQSNQDDYYVGGRNLPWWAVGISTMATQTSAISFISVPAFVAIKPGGGLIWLQYELAVPLSIIVVMALLVPFFRKLELVSVYEYLELRFGPSVRYLMSTVFLISRALATGIVVYASGIVLSVCLGIPLWTTILIIGIVTIIYDTIGGMAAVVYSDVIQMAVLVVGLVICIVYAANSVGGFGAVVDSFPAERWKTLDFSTGLGDGSSTPFWGFLIGSFFLYASYYGTDQSQVQRELSAPSVNETKRSLVFNGLARFPLTLLYVFLGLSIGAVYLQSDELRKLVPADHLDYLVPQFIIQNLPSGIRAILFAAILAAAMSSLDSALNSLSAATMRDFIERGRKLPDHRILLWSKLTTVMWGIIITGFAFIVGNISTTVIEGINKIGSAFYGPVLAAFLIGVLSKRATAIGVFAGVLAGVGFNLFLWIAVPSVFWIWWNLFGLIIAVIITFIVSLITAPPKPEQIRNYTLEGSGMLKQERQWIKIYALLFGYFVFILVFMLIIQKIF
ncbi:MAG: sodium:solute symporter family transporter [Candidatus Anammoxibacter sp.]